MLETFIREQKQQEILEKIQNIIRNAKLGITEYLNCYVKGSYDAVTSINSTGELLKMVGERIKQHLETIEKL